jgi:hypothetical protein
VNGARPSMCRACTSARSMWSSTERFCIHRPHVELIHQSSRRSWKQVPHGRSLRA